MMTIPPLAVAALWFAVILAMTAGFFLFVRRWAGKAGRDPLLASDMLTKFRELHASGGLSDSEYRTIKTQLAPELRSDPPDPRPAAAETRGQSPPASGGLSGLPIFRLLAGDSEED